MNTPTALFPLHTVLFPDGLLPLRIFEPRYVDMVRHCLREDRGFVVVPIIEGREAQPGARFHPDGTVARIEHWDQGEDGLLHLQVRGHERVRIHAPTTQPDGLALGLLEVVHEASAPVPAHRAYLGDLLASVYARHPEVAPSTPWPMADARWLAYRWAELLPLDLAARHALLTRDTALDKLEQVAAMVPPPPESTRHDVLH